MKRLFNALCFAGVPLVALAALLYGGLAYLVKQLDSLIEFDIQTRVAPLAKLYILIWIIIWVVSVLAHIYEYVFKHKRDFRIIKSYRQKLVEASPEKQAAMYPPVDNRYLSSNIQGMVLGTYNNQYVYTDLVGNEILHGLILGAPGCGKSSGPYITSLIGNFRNENPDYTVFCVDIKPELAIKSVDIENSPFVRVFNPSSHLGWGWDPYYNITQSSSDDDIMTELINISLGIIPIESEENSFFYESAQKIMQAVLLFYFRKGAWFDKFGNVKSGFIDSIHELVMNSTESLIKNILDDYDMMKSHPRIYALLNPFADKTSDAMQDIQLTLHKNLSVFMDETIKYHLQDNPNKCSPLDLEAHISVFLSLPEHMMSKYNVIFKMVVYQVLCHVQQRDENSDTITLILDEFPRLGKVPMIKETLATCRSRKVNIWIAIQALSQLENLYNEYGTRDIIALCEVHCLLSTNDQRTADIYSHRVGQYRETKTSTRVSSDVTSASSNDVNVSTEYRNILEPWEILQLSDTGEALIWIKGKYARINKFRYFENKKLSTYSQKVQKENKKVISDER